MDKFLKGAEDMANALGTSGKGEIDRGDGKIVSWSFKGQVIGIEWKYIGICVDRATGETTTAITQSKGGAIEHSMKDLFQRLASKNAL
ncbi:Hypothetical predicted protein [Mytilus galloprovincialis]|uniref:Uncharacterized protein n=1 Tax=Mytilus galloprovincialis TaxID=29158 RepID=A0A8B6H3J5_MYTGA|nr:Hypothetical predicted protein [Mytilus galloprovincialis]